MRALAQPLGQLLRRSALPFLKLVSYPVAAVKCRPIGHHYYYIPLAAFYRRLVKPYLAQYPRRQRGAFRLTGSAGAAYHRGGCARLVKLDLPVIKVYA